MLDSLGVPGPSLAEGDLIAGAVIVAKIVDTDGAVRLSVCWSDGMSWVERIGMFRAAEQIDLCDIPMSDA
jgi:hypothetical protein